MAWRFDGFRYVNLDLVETIQPTQSNTTSSWQAHVRTASGGVNRQAIGPSFGTHKECLSWLRSFLGGETEEELKTMHERLADYELWRKRALDAEAELATFVQRTYAPQVASMG